MASHSPTSSPNLNIITSPEQNRAYLVKGAECDVFCDREWSPLGHERLYNGNKDLKRYPGQIYDERKLKEIGDFVEDCISIWIDVDFDNDLDPSFRVRMEVNILNPFFATRLSKIISSPRISIRGKFRAPLTDNNRQEFNASDIRLDKPLTVIKSFHGSSKMIQLINQTPIGKVGHMKLKYSVYISWSNDPPTMDLIVMERMLNEKILADCVIIPSNQEEVKCHRSILAAASDVLHAMLTSPLEESQTRRIDMGDVSQEAVKALLEYLYGKKINKEEISERISLELFRTAHKYNIEPLENLLREMFLQKPEGWFSMNVVLELYFFIVNVEGCEKLCDKMLNILKKNSKHLRSATVYQDLKGTDPDRAAELVLKILQL